MIAGAVPPHSARICSRFSESGRSPGPTRRGQRTTPEGDRQQRGTVPRRTNKGSELLAAELAGAAIEPGSLPAFSTAGLDSTLGISGTLAYSGSLGFDFGGFVPQTATYRLGLAPGSILRERTVLTGTVRFNPDEVDFFKVELGVGAAPAEYFTLGEIHRGPVPEGGAIEVLDAPSLAPGAYMLRLALVKRDGNVMEPPYSIPIRIER